MDFLWELVPSGLPILTRSFQILFIKMHIQIALCFGNGDSDICLDRKLSELEYADNVVLLNGDYVGNSYEPSIRLLNYVWDVVCNFKV